MKHRYKFCQDRVIDKQGGEGGCVDWIIWVALISCGVGLLVFFFLPDYRIYLEKVFSSSSRAFLVPLVGVALIGILTLLVNVILHFWLSLWTHLTDDVFRATDFIVVVVLVVLLPFQILALVIKMLLNTILGPLFLLVLAIFVPFLLPGIIFVLLQKLHLWTMPTPFERALQMRGKGNVEVFIDRASSALDTSCEQSGKLADWQLDNFDERTRGHIKDKAIKRQRRAHNQELDDDLYWLWKDFNDLNLVSVVKTLVRIQRGRGRRELRLEAQKTFLKHEAKLVDEVSETLVEEAKDGK